MLSSTTDPTPTKPAHQARHRATWRDRWPLTAATFVCTSVVLAVVFGGGR